MLTSKKEPWNFDQFVRHYNKTASEQAGYIFNPKDDGQNPPYLQQAYEDGNALTMREYAERRFRYDQRF